MIETNVYKWLRDVLDSIGNQSTYTNPSKYVLSERLRNSLECCKVDLTKLNRGAVEKKK